MKKATRKPRLTKGREFPRLEVEDGRLWMQAVPSGKWVKVPEKRAERLAERLGRALRYLKEQF